VLNQIRDETGRLNRYFALASERVPLKGVLLLFLSIDAAFIVLNVLYTGEASNFSIEKDRGCPGDT
jgi:hypothetical protein